jgi:hypothetical protein
MLRSGLLGGVYIPIRSLPAEYALPLVRPRISKKGQVIGRAVSRLGNISAGEILIFLSCLDSTLISIRMRHAQIGTGLIFSLKTVTLCVLKLCHGA